MSLLSATIRLLTGDVRALDVAVVDTSGNQVSGFDHSRPATAAHTTVATSTTSATLFASNAARRQIFVHNDSNTTLFVSFAATATSTAFAALLPKNTAWASELNGYTGVVSGILMTGTGNARLTEVST